MELEVIELAETGWTPGTSSRFWYLQPHTQLTDTPPIVPLLSIEGETPGLRLLRAALDAEAPYPEPTAAPVFVILPEFAIHPNEVSAAIALAKAARRNTVVILGLGHLTEGQVRAIEPLANLWVGTSAGKFTNCAAVVLGQGQSVFLQPKIVRSRWEQDYHWPGRVVRYFVAKNFQFVVLICSELLDRPEGATTARAIVDTLHERGRELSLVVWIQHNPHPRSADFTQSVAEFRRKQSTVAIVGSRAARSPDRRNNFAVSGAVVPQHTLPAHFNLLTKRFQYVEPVLDDSALSRVVLLRYDADAYRVDTVLAGSIEADARVAKGALFEDSEPYVLDGQALSLSTAQFHTEDICARAIRLAGLLLPGDRDAVEGVGRSLSELPTPAFLAVLDVGILPRPAAIRDRHVAGVSHPGGDLLCRCWNHRECIDYLADDDDSAEPVAHLLVALGAMAAHAVPFRFAFDAVRRTNVVLQLDGADLPVGVVFPFHYDAEGAEIGLCGPRGGSLVDSAYVILGVGERPMRPRVSSVDAAVSRPRGAISAGIPARPVLKAVYSAEFWRDVDQGHLPDLFRQRLLGGR